MTNMIYDVAIIGAGIVGMATAFQLSERRPGLKIAVIDKEEGVARHQSGRNSGVIHSGIYYQPGGSKALNCRRGYRYLLEFCDKYGVRYDICGKVIVATREEERPALHHILERGRANGLEGLRLLSPEALREIEPHVSGVEAIRVPQSGIISYREVAEKYQELVAERGGEFHFHAPVTGIRIGNGQEIVVLTPGEEIRCRCLVNCAGLYSDRIAAMTMPDLNVQILPFRGEYYELVKEREHLVSHLIYPVPNADFPFLGVHFTRMIEGGIEAGPNAVLAFQREGYSRWDVDGSELRETLAYPGFRRIAARYWRTGLGEFRRSFSKRAFVRALRHLIPEVGMEDLQRGRSGVRAMACDRDGNLVDDFLILERGNVINVANAPSPAATASLSIGETVAERVLTRVAPA